MALSKFINIKKINLTRADVLISIAAIAIVFILIAPVPLIILDVLIALNICFCSLLIVTAIFLDRPINFSSFPAVILLTTVLRLSISVAVTRHILVNQDAGTIVESFGNFVVGGNLVVGLVMYLVLTVVNFMVITKGSERIAEVGARFTLDAMPGKQMAIDSDLRSGIISVAQAKSKRNELTKESKLFGAMDGAMKFIKGDAIASIIILAINLIGGTAIGVMQNDMELSDSLSLYAVLSIGDGLVAQIPALLVSLTSGFIITKVSSGSDEEQNIGNEITGQMVKAPIAWIVSSVGMLFFAVLPGMPTSIFLILAIISALIGIYFTWKSKKLKSYYEKQESLAPQDNGYSDFSDFVPYLPLMMRLNDKYRGNPIIDKLIFDLRRIRNKIVCDYGYPLPNLNVIYSERRSEKYIEFMVNNIDFMKKEIVTAEKDEDGSDNSELETACEDIRRDAESMFFTVSEQFIGLKETKKILDTLEYIEAELAQELQRNIPLSNFCEIIKSLVEEKITIKPIRSISEAVIMAASRTNVFNELLALVRVSIKEHITSQYTEAGVMHAILINDDFETYLCSLPEAELINYLYDKNGRWTDIVEELINTLSSREEQMLPVLIVNENIRRSLYKSLKGKVNDIAVIAYSELSDKNKIKVIKQLA